MKKRMSGVAAVFLLNLSLLTGVASAGTKVVIPVTGGHSSLEQFKVLAEDQGNQVTVLQDRSGKFENQNTFVQLYNPKVNEQGVKVVNQSVTVVLPQSLNFDTLMEALVKIRSAKTFGAREVSVYSEKPLRELSLEGLHSEELDLRALFATAGAEVLRDGNQVRVLSEAKPVKNPVTQSEYWIGGSQDPTLLNQVSSILGKKGYSFEELSANKDQLKGRKLYWFASTQAPVDHHFFQTLAQIHWLVGQGASVHLVSPYLPYARSDKPEFDVGVTTIGRLAADLIESMGTAGITVVRAHAPQSLGFFKIHSNEISGMKTIVEYLKTQEIECVISPDAGFQKDATKYQQKLMKAYGGNKSVCLAVMNKQRNSDGKETILGGTGIEAVSGKKVVIIDDETASGGTLGQVAAVVQKYQPKQMIAVVTHLAGSGQKGLDSPFIHSLVATNTVPVQVKHSKLVILSIAGEIAEQIQEAESNSP